MVYHGQGETPEQIQADLRSLRHHAGDPTGGHWDSAGMPSPWMLDSPGDHMDGRYDDADGYQHSLREKWRTMPDYCRRAQLPPPDGWTKEDVAAHPPAQPASGTGWFARLWARLRG